MNLILRDAQNIAIPTQYLRPKSISEFNPSTTLIHNEAIFWPMEEIMIKHIYKLN